MQISQVSSIREVLNVDGIAEHFGVSTRTIWTWVADGYFPAPYRIGRRMRYWTNEQIDGWLADGCPKVRNADSIQK